MNKMSKEQEKSCFAFSRAALMHTEAAFCLANNSDTKLTTARDMFLQIVHVELLLLSIEQSIKVFILLGGKNPPTKHNLDLLLSRVNNKFLNKAIQLGNQHTKYPVPLSAVSIKEVEATIKKQSDSYERIRYFGLSKKFVSESFGYEPREAQILHVLAVGFLNENHKNMRAAGLSPPSPDQLTQKNPNSTGVILPEKY